MTLSSGSNYSRLLAENLRERRKQQRGSIGIITDVTTTTHRMIGDISAEEWMILREMEGVVGIVTVGGDHDRGRRIQGPVPLIARELEVERSAVQGMIRLEGDAKDLYHLGEGDIHDHLPLEEDDIRDHQHHLWGTLDERLLLETAAPRLRPRLADYLYLHVGDLILVNGRDVRGTLTNNLVGIPTEREIRGPMGMQRHETEIGQGGDTTPDKPTGLH